MGVVRTIVSLHAEEAALLWHERCLAVAAPHYLLKDLADLDERVEAHLDGLLIAGAAGWETCLEETKSGEPEDLFPAAVMAFERGDRAQIECVLRAVEAVPYRAPAVVSALGWLCPRQAAGYVECLSNCDAPALRRIAVAAAAAHRIDPGAALVRAVEVGDARLRARALRAAGELGRRDLLPAAREGVQAADPGVRFWAAWTLARLSDEPAALDVLRHAVESQSPEEQRALQMVLGRMETADAARWLNHLAQDRRLVRQAVIGTAIVGTPEAISWLVEMMATPALARVAGEAFSMITGVDLAAEKLEGEWPEGFSAGPSEDPADENVAMDADENLAWPDAVRLAAWWGRHHSEFTPGTRYLCGRPMAESWLAEVLRVGYQRQRAAAALELALRRGEGPLFNVRAPGHRQQELLGLRKPSSS